VQHAPQPEWNDESFPDVSIVGFQKAGTSHLYKLLATHKSTVTVKGKEYCIDPGHTLVYDTNDYYYEDDVESQKKATQTWQRKLFGWHKSIYQKRKGLSYPSQRKILNGCLQFDELEFRIRYHPPTSFDNNTKLFLVILRDPADWMWAVFNFWYDRHLDTHSPDTHDWVDDPNKHYRSPELFHEFVASGERLKSAARKFGAFRERSVLQPRHLQYILGNNNASSSIILMFVKNEDLAPDRIVASGLLGRLAHASGLEINGFDPDILGSRTNCGADKGIGKSCSNNGNSTTTSNNAYPITRHRTLLAKTRKLIYLQWQEECHIWATEFGIVYPDCLEASKLVREQRPPH
jgi:hypothetical protein